MWAVSCAVLCVYVWVRVSFPCVTAVTSADCVMSYVHRPAGVPVRLEHGYARKALTANVCGSFVAFGSNIYVYGNIFNLRNLIVVD